MTGRVVAVLLLVVLAAVAPLRVVGAGPSQDVPAVPACSPGAPPVELAGSVTADDARTYQVHPFDVAPGTTRVEVTYDWADVLTPLPGTPVSGLVQTVIDAGLWDQEGYRAAAGFRGWSGSRAGRVSSGQPPIVVQQDEASRGYRPAPIEPGTWWLELGIAAVTPTGADWTATVTCSDPAAGSPFVARPVDADVVLDPRPGWYHADLHAHGHHSAGNAPPWDDIVEQARVAGLEVLPITEYVTGQHWDELGPVQADNPDVLIWPGREIITYFGHAIALGETRSVLEYRHGFEDVSLADIQTATLDDGALFGVAHPTIFPGAAFASLCRGCEFTLGHVIDWSRVDTIEVLTGPALATLADLGFPEDFGMSIANPFMRTAIELWDELLSAGHRITAVSGSDSKANEAPADRERVGIGSSATAIHAESLSRPALIEGLRAGRAYVRTLGALRSPELAVLATAPDGSTAGIGEDLAADTAELAITVRGGAGDDVVVIRNGEPVGAPVPVTGDPFTATVQVARHAATEGPLGTYVRVETIRQVEVTEGVAVPDLGLPLPAEVDVLRYPTTIANPVFLVGAAPTGNGGTTPAAGPEAPRATTLPATGPTGPLAPLGPLAVLALALAAVRATRRRGSRDGRVR